MEVDNIIVSSKSIFWKFVEVRANGGPSERTRSRRLPTMRSTIATAVKRTKGRGEIAQSARWKWHGERQKKKSCGVHTVRPSKSTGW